MPWSRDQVEVAQRHPRTVIRLATSSTQLQGKDAQKWLRFIVYNHPDTSGYKIGKHVTNPAQVMLNIAMNTRKLGDRSFALEAQSCPSLCHTLYSGTRTHLGPPLGPLSPLNRDQREHEQEATPTH